MMEPSSFLSNHQSAPGVRRSNPLHDFSFNVDSFLSVNLIMAVFVLLWSSSLLSGES